jgi:hypothetical protein
MMMVDLSTNLLLLHGHRNRKFTEKYLRNEPFRGVVQKHPYSVSMDSPKFFFPRRHTVGQQLLGRLGLVVGHLALASKLVGKFYLSSRVTAARLASVSLE